MFIVKIHGRYRLHTHTHIHINKYFFFCKEALYECRQCFEMNNITFTLFFQIWVEKCMALLKYSTHVHWFVSRGTVIVALLVKGQTPESGSLPMFLEITPGAWHFAIQDALWGGLVGSGQEQWGDACSIFYYTLILSQIKSTPASKARSSLQQ